MNSPDGRYPIVVAADGTWHDAGECVLVYLTDVEIKMLDDLSHGERFAVSIKMAGESNTQKITQL